MGGGDPVVGGRYRLGEVIGYGGMAEVHRGIDTRLGRTVAIKLLRASLASDSTFQARFRAEAQSAAALNHPNVISVYDFGDGASSVGPIAGLPYIVMEFVEGRTLREIVRQDRRLLPERALEIVADILSALGYSHRMGIIHRDIKPANVMLTPRGDVKVMDFGIARAVADTSSSMTQTSAVIGTAQYLSPEQARGLTADARSDLYSTGCVLYELLTGRPPFIGGSPVALALAHVRETAVPPDVVDPSVPAAASAVTMMALTKDPADRYASAADMRADVERALRGEPVHAPRVGAAAVADDERTEVFDPRPSGRGGAAAAGAAFGAGGLLGAAAESGAGGAPRAGESAAEETGWSVPAVSGPPGGGSARRLPVGDDSGPSADRRRRTELSILLVVVVLLVLAGLAFGFYRLSVGDSTPTPTPSPSASPSASVSSPSPSASVSSASPSPSSPSPSASVSSPASVTVPANLDGQQLGAVEQTLSNLGLNPVALGGVRSSEPANTVISTDPGPGAVVAKGHNVVIQYANGTTLVPDVLGFSLANATSSLEAAGFTVTPMPSGTGDGTVSRTSPSGGQTVTQGSTVAVFYTTAASASPSPSTSAPASADPSTAPSAPASAPGDSGNGARQDKRPHTTHSPDSPTPLSRSASPGLSPRRG
jgi:hypothetical protein